GQGHHHLRGDGSDPHALDERAPAHHPARDRGTIHRRGGGGRLHHPPARARPERRPADARPGGVHAIPARHQAIDGRGDQHHHRRRPRHEPGRAAGGAAASEAGDVQPQHGLDELQHRAQRRAGEELQARLGEALPGGHHQLHLPQHLPGHRAGRRAPGQGARHALRVRVLRRRPSLQLGAHAGPQGGGAAALRADDLRHPGRHRRRAAQSDVHEGDGGPAVRRRLRVVRAGRRPAPDALHHHGRDAGRQRPRRAGRQPVARQGRGGQVQRRAGVQDTPHPGGAEPGNRIAHRGAGDARAEGRRRGRVL
ncbi:MAG: hypothetical protein AF1210, partial [uncultured Acetobacteraceae bacterium]